MNKQTQPQNFEAAMNELEQIVQQLQGGNLSLEDALDSFKRGIELSQYCQKSLKSAEETISKLKEQSYLNTDQERVDTNGE